MENKETLSSEESEELSGTEQIRTAAGDSSDAKPEEAEEVEEVEAGNLTEAEEEEAKDPAKANEEEKENARSKAVFKEFMSYVVTFIIAIAAAALVNNFILINATVPTGSMLQTIQLNDRLLGSRIHYLFTSPKRGDVIIFYYPDAYYGTPQKKTLYIKRVIGLPGETVEVKSGKVYINGSETPLDEPYINPSETPTGNFGPYVVPDNGYFVMGDNRNHSTDARMWHYHYVASDLIVGKAFLTYWPFKDWKFFRSYSYE